MCGKITLRGQLLTIRDKKIQTCLQIFVKLMHYFAKFGNFFIINCKFDIRFKLGFVARHTLSDFSEQNSDN